MDKIEAHDIVLGVTMVVDMESVRRETIKLVPLEQAIGPPVIDRIAEIPAQASAAIEGSTMNLIIYEP